jgi:hypothetical protein
LAQLRIVAKGSKKMNSVAAFAQNHVIIGKGSQVIAEGPRLQTDGA